VVTAQSFQINTSKPRSAKDFLKDSGKAELPLQDEDANVTADQLDADAEATLERNGYRSKQELFLREFWK